MTAQEVSDVIASLDGGYNGSAPNKRLAIAPAGTGRLNYQLVDESTDPPTVEQYVVTIASA